MIGRVIVDTDAIVAVLSEEDSLHKVASAKFDELPKPFYTCEAVLSEACFLVKSSKRRREVLKLFDQGVIKMAFSFNDEIARVAALMEKYSDVPMSFADACLVRMSEILTDSVVFSFDSDFRIYRRNRNENIPMAW